MGDFNHKQPAPQGNSSTERAPKEQGTPRTGFSNPKSAGECGHTEVGKGVGNSRRGIR